MPFKFDFKLSERTKKILIVLLSLSCLAVILFNFKDWFVVVLVNNRPITRYSLVKELEKRAGKQVLEDLITRDLIFQEAEKQGIQVSQEEMKAKIKELEEQAKGLGGDLDSFLQMQGQTRKELEEQIRVQLVLDKMLGQDVGISEEEIQQYFEENKDFFSVETEFETIKEDLRENLRREKINEKLQSWLGELRTKAKIRYFLKF